MEAEPRVAEGGRVGPLVVDSSADVRTKVGSEVDLRAGGPTVLDSAARCSSHAALRSMVRSVARLACSLGETEH
jgi:hypothetical protein